MRRNDTSKMLTLSDLDGGAKSVKWDPLGEFLAASGALRAASSIPLVFAFCSLLLRKGTSGEMFLEANPFPRERRPAHVFPPLPPVTQTRSGESFFSCALLPPPPPVLF